MLAHLLKQTEMDIWNERQKYYKLSVKSLPYAWLTILCVLQVARLKILARLKDGQDMVISETPKAAHTEERSEVKQSSSDD